MKYILKPSITLLLTAVVTVAALSFVHEITLKPIEYQKNKTREAAMREVMPHAESFKEIQTEMSGSMTAVFEGYTDEILAGYIIQIAPEGYSGKIHIITGISVPDEILLGMRVIRHSETPGLGALAVKANFYQQFNNRALVPLGISKAIPSEHEIQVITSSTITTRAITNAINEVMEWYLQRAREGEVSRYLQRAQEGEVSRYLQRAQEGEVSRYLQRAREDDNSELDRRTEL